MIDSMLDTQFWTLGAFKFGAGAAKLSISPAVKKATPDTGSGTESPEYLSEFLMQLQTDAKTMPIEDTTIE